MGGIGTGMGFRNNVGALADIKLNLRTVHRVNAPFLATTLFGQDMSMPVLAAAIGGTAMNMKADLSEAEYSAAVISGSVQSGVLGMTGDGPKPEVFQGGIVAISAEQGRGIPIIKPREPERIVQLANEAAQAGAVAFGIDIDAAALINMTRMGQPVGPKSFAELEFIKRNTKIPFIVKGIMTVDEALACVEAGVDAIVVSNHGGRAMDHTPGTAEVLPSIAKAVQGRLVVMVDGGVRTGTDVLKMLALGAEFVLVGRPVIIGAVGGGAAGVKMVMNRIADELRTAMILTGTSDVRSVSSRVIYPPAW
jgi:isopentenyl diphosphate isomerase/L-lactate dehydrogenase-like FMN-dependent dehydrogenase